MGEYLCSNRLVVRQFKQQVNQEIFGWRLMRRVKRYIRYQNYTSTNEKR